MSVPKIIAFVPTIPLSQSKLTFCVCEPRRKTSLAFRHTVIKAQLPTPGESSSSESFSESVGSENNYRKLLRRLESEPNIESVEEEETLVGERASGSNSLLALFFDFLKGGFNDDLDRIFSNPVHLILASALCILFGFFSATSASTIIGSVADWDPLAAAVLLIWTESFTKFYYTRLRPTRLMQLINAFKVGLIYGMTVDAFKLTT